jgi:arylsulfatase A-like enzyme
MLRLLPRPTPRAALLLVALACAACGSREPEPVRHRRLADGFRPQPVEPGRAWHETIRGAGASTMRPDTAGPGLWLESRIPTSAWAELPTPGLWVARRVMPEGGKAPPSGSPPHRLRFGEKELSSVTPEEALSDPDKLEPGHFCAAGGRLYARLDPALEAPGEARLAEYFHRGEAQGEAWRVKVGRYRADGIPLLAGLREVVRCDLPPASALRFATAARSPVAAAEGEAPPAEFRVLLNGQPIFDYRHAASARATVETHVLALPAGGMRDAELAFEVRGDSAACAILAPVVGPLEVGDYRSRPWPTERPDVLLFLADTFRADNMALYGGDPLLTPNLDRFAQECLRFQECRSSSNWTLPTHATLFSGFLPYQCGVSSRLTRLSEAIETVAERLRRAGYRTAAVTDHVFVSSTYGLDQGFEIFDEELGDLERTLRSARSLLDADDGRPLFLFVHTYRTHVPYHVSEETRARLGAHLGIVRDFPTLRLGEPKIPVWVEPGTTPDPELAQAMRETEALYRGGAADLDLGFERLRAELEARGFLEDGWLIFTSDHGEGFWEHGRIGHGSLLYEEHLRVPLLIHGPDVAPRSIAHPASSVDLPRTIARMAGVPPVPAWQGQDLLALEEDRTVFAYQCHIEGKASSMAIVAEGRKLIGPAVPEELAEGALDEAYDLRVDAGERDERIERGERWPARLLESLLEPCLKTLEQRFETEAATFSPEDLQRMRALGYL